MTRSIVAATIAAGLTVSAALAESPPPGLAAKLRQVVSRDGAPGVTALVLKNGRLLYRLDEGAIAPDARLAVASASKWMTASLVMTVVDEGKLKLDEPIGKLLPQFTGRAGQITLRELLSFTAGQGGLKPDMFDLRQDPRISLAEAAAQVAARPLVDEPGTTFRYGGPSMQVAGALVEQATGKSWATLFQERIAGPLGMTHTYWANPLNPELKPAAVHNPNLQAGVYTTAEDYAKFLTMLAAGGVYRGKRILSAEAVDRMETWQTRGRRMAYLPPGAGDIDKYALGNWCDAVESGSDRCWLVSSPGAFGTFPWIDRRSGLYGVFFLKYRLPEVVGDLRAARDMIIAADQETTR
ncbi:beta-lactamase family protein [Sphingomonas sp. CL5.1]|uniref:serine hydrolase domain-containing protein n=1 Tax=Sphingomonas sp. CL5.1 TaxID=2653203 RepID=UPI0015835AF2|nr:serine hydrolase domain-containing protein [Sphingomonas sp. CL5.1]QKS00492.1 beta-lactamase family protein [Sphingomonas sp. CL5.1]